MALFCIYALLAVPFRSFSQPLIVMSAIPFGIVGAVWGHLLMGFNISIVSLFGIVGLSGVVVNDSLVLIDRVNALRRDGDNAHDAVVKGGMLRFRAIILTSLTTFAGLTPMLLGKKPAGPIPDPHGGEPGVRRHVCHRHHSDSDSQRIYDSG